ncbi:MAG: SAM-dependent methyltransferase, partial [Oscillibacter sp.]|nr:SAM-dependent methyltransferase [Oscillibacter sp.]
MSDLISVPPPDFATGTVSASGSAFGCAADTRSYDADAPSARPAVWTMEAIAHVRSDFPGKFGVPRQSGLVEALEARVVFMPSYRNRDALRGLEGFSHIWLVWVFDRAVRDTRAVRGGGESQQKSGQQSSIQHGNGQQGSIQQESVQQGSAAAPVHRWSPTVRPPRLGGNARLGVFATRSPFRPNPIGLSCVRLDGIDDTAEGPVLHIRGADLADGTPVLDIKPYVPYADSRPEAAGGFASTAPEAALDVEIPPSLLERVPAGRREALVGVL